MQPPFSTVTTGVLIDAMMLAAPVLLAFMVMLFVIACRRRP